MQFSLVQSSSFENRTLFFDKKGTFEVSGGLCNGLLYWKEIVSDFLTHTLMTYV